METQVADYIVVGTGLAGCAFGRRLVKAVPSVLLHKTGPADANKFVKAIVPLGTEMSR